MIAVNVGMDGVPLVQWPERFETDDSLASVVQWLRQRGLSTSVQIDKVMGGMMIMTQYERAVYKRGFYQPTPEFGPATWVSDEYKQFESIQFPEPIACWIFDSSVRIMRSAPSHRTLALRLAKYIPDINKKVTPPCGCLKFRKPLEIWYVIQHLNDGHHPRNGKRDVWTRERIADWLDEQDADLVFDPDLPAKRRAEFLPRTPQQAQEAAEQFSAGLISAQAYLEELKASIDDIDESAKQAQTGMVKLSVAIKGFQDKLTSSVHKVLGIEPETIDCTCDACKDMYNLEES